MGLAVTQIAVDQHGRMFAIDTSGAIWAMHMSTGGAWTKMEGPSDTPLVPPPGEEGPPPELLAGTEVVEPEDEHETKTRQKAKDHKKW